MAVEIVKFIITPMESIWSRVLFSLLAIPILLLVHFGTYVILWFIWTGWQGERCQQTDHIRISVEVTFVQTSLVGHIWWPSLIGHFESQKFGIPTVQLYVTKVKFLPSWFHFLCNWFSFHFLCNWFSFPLFLFCCIYLVVYFLNLMSFCHF